MKNPETLTLFKKIFDERKNPENSDNLRLVWNYTTEEKLDKFEEYMDIWKKINEDAQGLEEEKKKIRRKEEN